MKEKTAQDHLDMVHDPDRWPRWPILPVKTYDESLCARHRESLPPLCGILTDCIGDGPGITVYLVNMCFLPGFLRSGKKMSDLPSINYPTDAGFLADGWVVD